MGVAKKTDKKKQEFLPKEEKEQTDLSVLMPLGEKWIDSQNEQAQLNNAVYKEELALISSSNKRNYNLLIIIIVGIFAMSSGIIFYLGKLEAGLLVLSHVGAVVSGLLAGMGIQKSRTRKK